MTFIIDHQDSRTIKALEIAAGASSWLRLTDRKTGEVGYGIPSQCAAKAGLYYTVTATFCDCQDAKRSGLSTSRIGQAGDHRICKHSLAVRLYDELVKAQQPKPKLVTVAAPTRIRERPVLTMVRNDDDTVSWERTSDVERAARYDAIFGKDGEF